MNKKLVVAKLQQIFNMELEAGVHYFSRAYSVVGTGRDPIASFLKGEVDECHRHAGMAAEKIMALGETPEVHIRADRVSKPQPTKQLLKECVKEEQEAVALYRELLPLVQEDVVLENMVRTILIDELEGLQKLDLYLREP